MTPMRNLSYTYQGYILRIIVDVSVLQWKQIKSGKLSRFKLNIYKHTDPTFVIVYYCLQRQYIMCVNIDPCGPFGTLKGGARNLYVQEQS